LLWRFSPQLVGLMFTTLIFAGLDYLGPISLDLLTKKYYEVKEPQVI